MAELLWGCGHEESDRGTESEAISQNPNVYMETVEENQNKTEKPYQTWHPIELCKDSGE